MAPQTDADGRFRSKATAHNRQYEWLKCESTCPKSVKRTGCSDEGCWTVVSSLIEELDRVATGRGPFDLPTHATKVKPLDREAIEMASRTID